MTAFWAWRRFSASSKISVAWASNTASVASVVIDTALGELTLPYWSALGIEKIIRQSSGQIDIYFGELCPEFETGRVYFAQGAAGLTQYQWYLAAGGTLSFDEWVSVASAAVPEAAGRLL